MAQIDRLSRQLQILKRKVGPQGPEGEPGEIGPSGGPEVFYDITGTNPEPTGTPEDGSIWFNGHGTSAIGTIEVWVRDAGAWVQVIKKN